MLSQDSTVEDLLNAFEQIMKTYPSDIPWCVEIGKKDANYTVAFGSAIHGNETGSLPAVLSLLAELSEESERLNGRYLFFIGNPSAVLAGCRFVERDLNRCFDLLDSTTLEGKRAHELARVLVKADLFVDYHQTNQPAVFPFFTFAYHEDSYRWAVHMKAAEHFVTRDMKIAFSTEGMCGDEWVRKRGKPAVTLELGRAGLSHSAYQITLSSLQRVVGFVETELARERIPSPALPTADEDLKFFQVIRKLPWPGDGAALNAGFENFQFVKRGEELGLAAPHVKLTAPDDGYLLFPKYPKRGSNGKPLETQSGDIVQIIQPLTRHPRDLWG